jgi:hypothetical protein
VLARPFVTGYCTVVTYIIIYCTKGIKNRSRKALIIMKLTKKKGKEIDKSMIMIKNNGDKKQITN